MEEPGKPGGEEPGKPGTPRSFHDPGKDDPSKPGTNDPSDPGKVNPEKPADDEGSDIRDKQEADEDEEGRRLTPASKENNRKTHDDRKAPQTFDPGIAAPQAWRRWQEVFWRH